MKFKTNFVYTDRQTKAHYVYLKYQPILVGNILDVGADQCYFKEHLGNKANYIGIGLSSDKLDLKINLEKQSFPYKDNSFDVVLCFDVLEHLDNIHEVFDELCRVARKYLIISLPNPWVSFMGMLKGGYYKHGEFPMKFYNLPTNPPNDRHKWFYGVHEAEKFLKERGKMNGMKILQVDKENTNLNFRKFLYRMFLKLIVHNDVDVDSLLVGSIWAVLIKSSSNH